MMMKIMETGSANLMINVIFFSNKDDAPRLSKIIGAFLFMSKGSEVHASRKFLTENLS